MCHDVLCITKSGGTQAGVLHVITEENQKAVILESIPALHLENDQGEDQMEAHHLVIADQGKVPIIEIDQEEDQGKIPHHRDKLGKDQREVHLV